MRPIIIAHRGASAYLPEHTLPAKVLAHAMGADYLEQDVVASRDDELIVLHDIHLDRVSNVAQRFPDRARDDGRYYVRDFDLAELRQLRIHERRTPTDSPQSGTPTDSPVYAERFESAGEPFQLHTLGEEIRVIHNLNRTCGRNAGIYPEIKRPAWHRAEGIDLSRAVLDELREYGYADRGDAIYLQCFDAVEVVRLREEFGTSLKLIQLIGENDWHEAATDYNELRTPTGLAAVARVADGIGPWIPQTCEFDARRGGAVSLGLVEAAHKVGLAVHPYTFRRDDLPPGCLTFANLVDFCVKTLGVDGLFTDFPDLVLKRL